LEVVTPVGSFIMHQVKPGRQSPITPVTPSVAK